ncbi:hypothetical protein ACFE04_010689 [Oxalis oulophora]
MAADSSSSFIPDLPIFNGKDHFGDWQLQMKTFFMSQGLWHIIENGLTNMSAKDKLQQKGKGAHALYCIQRALAPTIFRKINNPKLSAKQAWDILDREYNFHQLKLLAEKDFHTVEILEDDEEEIALPRCCIEVIIPNEEEEITLPRDCIKVTPNEIRELNPAAYKPKVISIGPLHHGIPNLLRMQKLKIEYAKSFLKQTQKPKAFFVHFIQKNEESIRLSYSEKCPLESKDYVEMIMLDSFFILEFFIKYAIYSISLRNSNFLSTQDHQMVLRDSLWADPGLLKKIMEDLLMFENQLPFLLLSKLLDLSGQRVELRNYYLIISHLRLDSPNTEHFHLNDIMNQK